MTCYSCVLQRKTSENSLSSCQLDSNVVISTQNSLSSLLRYSMSAPLPATRAPSSDAAQIGKSFSALLASEQTKGVRWLPFFIVVINSCQSRLTPFLLLQQSKKQTFLLGNTERLNRLGVLLLGEEKGPTAKKRSVFKGVTNKDQNTF